MLARCWRLARTNSTLRQARLFSFFEAQQAADYQPEAWGRAAAEYDRAFSGKFESYAAEALDRLEARSPAGISRLLDVGCGTGAVLKALATHKLGESLSSLNCIDFSPGMVSAAQRNLASMGGLGSLAVRIETGDGQALAFKDNSFDAAVGMFSLMFFPDRSAGLREMRRVTTGAVLVAGWAIVKELEWVHFSNKALKNVLVARKLSLPEVERSAVPNFLCWADGAAFKQELQDAGFTNVEVAPVKKRFELRDADAAAQMWHDMADSFPTLNYVCETLGGGDRTELEAEVATEFANVIHEQRGSNSEFGYLEGTAMFGLGQSSSH